MARTFGEMVDEGLKAKGWSDYQLSAAIGLLPGDKAFNPTQIRRLKRGERRNLSRPLVAKLIELLELDPLPAWRAAGLWPEGVEPEDLRDISERVATRRTTAASRVARSPEGATAATTPVTSHQQDSTMGTLTAWPAPPSPDPICDAASDINEAA